MWIFSVFGASGDLNGRLLPSKPSEVENDRVGRNAADPGTREYPALIISSIGSSRDVQLNGVASSLQRAKCTMLSRTISKVMRLLSASKEACHTIRRFMQSGGVDSVSQP